MLVKKCGCIAILLCFLAIFTSRAFALYINLDVQQTLIDSQDNYEIVLKGDKRTALTGSYINAFPGGNPVQISYDGENTTISYSGDELSQDMQKDHHFGFQLSHLQFGYGVVHESEEVIRKYWTRSSDLTETDVPAVNKAFTWNVNMQQVEVSLENLSLDTVSLFSVGFLSSPTFYPLEDLNRSILPPTMFDPSGIADGTELLPGESVSFLVDDVALGEFVTVFVDSQFSGASAQNLYQGYVGEWAEFQTAVPEPSTWLLLYVGVVAFAGISRKS